MRIATLTLNVYGNYGNILQKFALYRTLEKFADFVEVLWHPRLGTFNPYELEADRFKVGNMRDATFNGVQRYNFKKFHDANMRTRYDLPYIEDIADEYDFFVVGSDNLWNPNNKSDKNFFNFLPREKKISYAVSVRPFTAPPTQEILQIFRRGISGFKHLSIREELTAELVEKITGRRPLSVLDPIFLLNVDEWLAVAQKPTWLKENYRRGYILTYYLRRLPPPEVKTLAAELNLPVINLLDLLNYNYFTVGPAEFVWLFANASLIVANSFHAVAFAILFKRAFINQAFKDDNHGMEISHRLINLLKLFGLESRRTFGDKIFTADEALTIDFTRRDEVLPVERDKAFKFLSEALGVKPRKKFQR